MVGINSRLDTVQAALLLVKLRHLETWTTQRRMNAARYQELFSRYHLEGQITVPREMNGYHVWNQFTIRVHHGQRDALRAYLAQHQIGSEVYYPVPLHQQECFRELEVVTGSLPETERAAAEVLSLPVFPGLTAAEQETVVYHIDAFFQTHHAG